MITNNKQQRKKNSYARVFLLAIITIFSVALISAQTPLEEFLDTFDLEVTITQDNSTAEFNMDLTNTSFDEQSFKYKDFEVEGIYLSSFLDGIDFKARTEKGWNYTQFDYFNVQLGSTTQFLLDNAFAMGDVDLTCSQINSNVTLLNEFLLRHPLNIKSDRTIILEKQGTNYKLYTNTGIDSIKGDYKNQIADILKESVYSVNIESLVKKAIPLIDYNLSFLEELDLDYQVSIINLDEIEIDNGEYDVEINIIHENTNITKTIKLIINGIESESYAPENTEVLQEIKGLKFGTIVTIETINETSKPSNTNALGYLNISASQETSGEIYFKVNKSNVIDKNKISLYVYENDWVKLSTTLISESDFYFYKATTPHFSIFLIAEDTYVAPSSSGSSGSSSHHHGGSSVKKKVIPTITTNKTISNETNDKPLINLIPKEKTFSEQYGKIIIIISGIIILIIVIVAFILAGKKKECIP